MSAAFRLESVCTLREATALKVALMEQLDLSGDVAVDGGAVERIDTAGLQLLAAFALQLRASGRALNWTAHSAELTRSAAQLDLGGVLGLPA